MFQQYLKYLCDRSKPNKGETVQSLCVIHCNQDENSSVSSHFSILSKLQKFSRTSL